MNQARYKITNDAQVLLVCAHLRRLAQNLGFCEKDLAEIQLCAAELGTNMTSHRAENPVLSFSQISEDGMKGIEITASDQGPGIKDVKKALEGGSKGTISLGQGLAAVQRVSDEFEISTSPQGTLIKIRKYLEPADEGLSRSLRVSVAVRTHPDSNVCGDGHMIRHYRSGTLVAVIDGLGHGENARKASAKAEAYLSTNFRKYLSQMPEELHSALHQTRGAVAGIARIEENAGTVWFAGVGNISARLWQPETEKWTRLPSMSGTLGVSLRTPRIFSYPWERESMLILHSDGLKDHWELTADELKLHPNELSRMLLDKLWRKNDDATVLVAG